MKTIFLTLSLLFVSAFTFGQLKEGKIDYSVTFSTSDPSVQAQLSMLSGSTMNLTFANEGSIFEMAFGMFSTTKTISNIKDKKTLILMGGMMGNKAILKDTEPLEADDAPMIEKTSETKTIAGYKCTKYIADLGPEVGIAVYWVTSEIEVTSMPENKFIVAGLGGTPLELEMETNGLTITIVAKAVAKSLKKENKATLFSTAIPEGYEVMTMDELEEMGGM